jgi:uncharacterized protein YcfL
MKRFAILFLSLFWITVVPAQETVEVTDLIVQQMDNSLLQITIEITNSTTRKVSEVAGYVDIYNNRDQIVEKEYVQIQMIHDVPLNPGESKSRNIIVTQRPNMSGTARYRITNLRFFGEQSVYMICPNCGEVILKDD